MCNGATLTNGGGYASRAVRAHVDGTVSLRLNARGWSLSGSEDRRQPTVRQGNAGSGSGCLRGPGVEDAPAGRYLPAVPCNPGQSPFWERRSAQPRLRQGNAGSGRRHCLSGPERPDRWVCFSAVSAPSGQSGSLRQGSAATSSSTGRHSLPRLHGANGRKARVAGGTRLTDGFSAMEGPPSSARNDRRQSSRSLQEDGNDRQRHCPSGSRHRDHRRHLLRRVQRNGDCLVPRSKDRRESGDVTGR